MDYETGLWMAFLTWSWGLINIVVSVNTRMEKNLNTIGQRLSWISLKPKAMDIDDQDRPVWKSVGKFLLIAVIGLPFILLSWLQVLIFVGMILYQKSRDAGAPQVVRAFRWKLRNVDMNFDDLVRELLKAGDKPSEDFEATKASLIAEMEEIGLRVSTSRR
jgi:hypothetical protein